MSSPSSSSSSGWIGRWVFFCFFYLFTLLFANITTTTTTNYVGVLAEDQGEGIPNHKLRAAVASSSIYSSSAGGVGRVGGGGDDADDDKNDDAVPNSSWSLFPTLKQQSQTKKRTTDKDDYDVFVEWCREHLGVLTLLEIKTFYYHDSIQAMKDRVDVFGDDDDMDEEEFFFYDESWFEYSEDDDDQSSQPPYNKIPSMDDYPMIPVRGLAASQDIDIGEVLIDIPHDSLWTLQVIIDQDPVLSQVMGPAVRKQNRWFDGTMDEIPLLAVALLYHLEHLEESPYQPYLSFIAGQQPQQLANIPHLWNDAQLRRDATVGVRRVAKGIQTDVREMYQQIVTVLIKKHPDIFGRPPPPISEDDDEIDDDRVFNNRRQKQPASKEWMYSFERFHWAFALINSRHWHLPLPALTTPQSTAKLTHKHDETMETDHTTDMAQPPASMPTDQWLDRQRQEQARLDEQQEREAEESNGEDAPESGDDADDDGDGDGDSGVRQQMGNSFLAPMADLLNFGPPCTRGVYNKETRSFQILATCKFRKGQEITFWYADACQDVFMANYGFVHPAVPPCPNLLKEEIAALEDDLDFALDRLDFELDRWWHLLKDCDCAKAAFEALLQLERQLYSAEEQHGTGTATSTDKQDTEEGMQVGSVETASSSKSGAIPIGAMQSPSPLKVAWKPTATPAATTTTTTDSARHAIRGGEQPSHADGLRRGVMRSNKRSRKSDL